MKKCFIKRSLITWKGGGCGILKDSLFLKEESLRERRGVISGDSREEEHTS
jgi:hypothetical protein